jgi:hypothetical protein
MSEPAKVIPFEPEQPTPLFRPLAPQEEYPTDAIPDTLWNGVEGVFGRTQAPVALVAQSIMAAAALAAQREVDVMLHTGQSRPTSLFFATLAESGERKSSADSEACAPARAFERRLAEGYPAATEEHRIKFAAWETRDKELRRENKSDRIALEDLLRDLGPPPRAPMEPIIMAGGDPTFEGVCLLLERGPGYCGMYSAEGGQFTGGHAMSQDNKLKTAAGLSGLWDGEPIRRIRRGDGATVLSGRRACLHLMLQPGAAASFLSDRVLLDQGLLSRVLVAYPESNMGRRFGERTADSEAAFAHYLAHLSAIWERPAPYADAERPGELSPRKLTMANEADRAIRAFATWVEKHLGDGASLRPISGFANKLAEHATRIAGVFAYTDDPDAATIPGETMERGIQLARWYATEALRLFDAGRLSPELLEAENVRAWLIGHWAETHISVTDLVQRGPGFIRESVKARKVIAILEGNHWLRRIEGGTKILDANRREAWLICGRPV